SAQCAPSLDRRRSRTHAGLIIRRGAPLRYPAIVLLFVSSLLMQIASVSADRAPISFHDQVIPALTRLGCNQGSCHGTPNGKGGFRLSLQGYAPEFDYAQLALQGSGRRTNRADPGSSLILLKATAKLPHGGGLRLRRDYPEWEVMTR